MKAASALFLGLLLGGAPGHGWAQPLEAPVPKAEEEAEDVRPQTIEVTPVAADAEIAERLERILAATEWFEDPRVRVEEGVVFLEGRTLRERRRLAAAQLAESTEGVVLVVNRIEVIERSMWDFTETRDEVRGLARAAVRIAPLVLLGCGMLVVSWFAAALASRGTGALLRRRMKTSLLRRVVANTVALAVFVIGVYLVLRVSGLTRLAVTVLGGTGLIGLVVGFAFRDIAENFLASVLLSMQRPFSTGDMISVAGQMGVVQQVNARATLLMTPEGNHVQIPNATIYKEIITNLWANPQMRSDFTVGIGYDDTVSEAQAVGLRVLREHPAVLADPEPLVLVESLGAATVNLRFYFWSDVRRHSVLKVKSALIRLTKRAFQDAGVSMPDEQREIVFPNGVPVRMLPADEVSAEGDARADEPAAPLPAADREQASTSEGGLASEVDEIEQQSRRSRLPGGGRNLLDDEE